MKSFRVWILAVAVAGLLGGGALIVAGMSSDEPAPAPAQAAAKGRPVALPTSPAASPTPTGPSAAQIAAANRVKQVRALDAALKKLGGSTPDFSVAVFDRKTGQRYAWRGTAKFDTASIVKTQILACMLLKAQDAGRRPTSAEMALAKPMIRLSDNNATTTLYQRLGGRSAVTKCNKRMGMTQTVVDSRWGLTKTTAADQIVLLESLVNPRGPLDAASRKTAFTLMNTVDKAQDWGVPVLAGSGEISIVKNGWDTRSADGGLWAVNTIGRITSKNGKVDVSVAVLSDRNASQQAGMTLVEKVAKLTRQHLKY